MMTKVRLTGCALCSLLGLFLWSALAQADVFPNPNIAQDARGGTDQYNGVKKVLMVVVHDVDDPYTTTEWNTRVNSLRSKERSIREFYATNSGGRFDFYYESILDIPIQLNSDNTRPGNFDQLVLQAAQAQGKNPSDYYLIAYDLTDTRASSNQGWAGLSFSEDGVGKNYLQSTSTNVIQHELGHQVGADHAKAFSAVSNSSFHPYTYNPITKKYDPYVPGVSPYNPVPFGVASYEYANPFDTMGNSSTGDFRIREKVEDLQWIPASQFPRVDGSSGLGAGTHRIYAHDELQAVTNAQGMYGVKEGYATGVYYGLQYRRQGERFVTGTNAFFEADTQTIDIEYRSGADGAYFYLDGVLIDLDSNGNNFERLLEVGRSIEDINMGMSTFIVDAGAVGQSTPTIDFMNFNPPAPTLRASSWWNITAVATGVNSIGSYIDLKFEWISALNNIAGDLNQDNQFNELDLQLFIAGWRTDTTNMSSIAKYRHGDMNFDGITDLRDAFLFRQALLAPASSMAQYASMFGGAPVPEPSSLCLIALAGLAVLRCRRNS